MIIDLPVPYLSQRDNEHRPGGTCNVTSVAMVMRFFGIVGDGHGQLEDQLFRKMEREGWNRLDPYHLSRLFRWKGLRNRFNEYATWIDVRAHLAARNPVIVHGWFTQPSGHVVVIRGWDPERRQWIVNDPAGEWQDGPSPYGNWRRAPAGNGSRFSEATMARLCGPFRDSSLWAHFPSRV